MRRDNIFWGMDLHIVRAEHVELKTGIRLKGGMSATGVDTTRFPRRDSGIYQSAGYESAADRAELIIESGMASVTVK